VKIDLEDSVGRLATAGEEGLAHFLHPDEALAIYNHITDLEARLTWRRSALVFLAFLLAAIIDFAILFWPVKISAYGAFA
jgi:hypothetical protein